MPAQLLIDQAGLPPGTPGFARTDGLDTAALVTLTSTGGGITHSFRLLWVPPGDTTAVSSLTQTTPTTATFTPSAGVYGSYRIELVVDAGLPSETRQIKIFAIRTPVQSLLIPAANEVANPSASLLNDTPLTVAGADQNEPFGPFLAGSSWGWFRAFEELASVVEAGIPTTLVGPSNCIFVDVAGNDATGARGDASKPFATINAALAVALDGDQLRLSPGTHTISAGLSWGTLTDLSIVGSGVQQTVINADPALASPLIDIPLGFVKLRLADLSLNNANLFAAIRADGTGAAPPPSYLSGGLFLQNVFAKANGTYVIECDYVAEIYAQGLTVSTNAVRFDTCNVKEFFDVRIAASLELAWDDDAADKPGPREAFRPSGLVVASDVFLEGQAQIFFDGSCQVLGLLAGNSLSEATTGLVPRIEAHGHIGGVDFTGGGAIPDTATSMVLDLSAITLDPLGGTVLIEVAGAAVNRQNVKMDGVSVPAAGGVIVGDGIDLFDRYAEASSGMYSTPGTGTFTPGRWIDYADIIAVGPQVVPFGFTAFVAPFSTVAVGDSAVLGTVFVPASTANDVTVDRTAGNGKAHIIAAWRQVY